MAKASELKRGHVVTWQGRNYAIREVERSAPTGRGGNTTYRFALVAIPGGQRLELSLRAEDLVDEVDLAKRAASYSYRDGEAYVFLDAEDYTPYPLTPEQAGDLPLFLEGERFEGAQVLLIDGEPVGLQLPATVELTIVETPPYLRGASATGRNKPARLATGLEVQVPEYLENGARIRVQTETHGYAGRAE